MTDVQRGQEITLTSQWYEYGGGPAADLASITITITLSGEDDPVVGPTSVGIAHPATGVYTYAWTVPTDAPAGDATITWNGVDADTDDVSATEILTVLPATTVVHGYCTLAELRAHFRDTGEILDTDALTRAINSASRWIDKHTGRRFWQDSTVQSRTYRPEHSAMAWVDDISTTDGLIIATDTSGDGTYATTWAVSDYELEPENAEANGQAYAWWRVRAVGNHTFPASERRRPLRVTARFGWSEVPDEVAEACILKAAAIYQRRESPLGVAGFGDFGPVRIGRYDPDVNALLAPFVRLEAARI